MDASMNIEMEQVVCMGSKYIRLGHIIETRHILIIYVYHVGKDDAILD